MGLRGTKVQERGKHPDWFQDRIAANPRRGYTPVIGKAGVFLAEPRVRFVFSVSVRDVQLGSGGPPGEYEGEAGWRAVTRVLRSSLQECGTAMEWVVADFANLLMPSDCRVCGAAMAALARVRVCEACVARLGAHADFGQDVLCTRCGDAMGMESARFAAAMGVGECTMCRLAPPDFDRAVAYANYEDEMRRMLHLLKFEGMRWIADHVLADAMVAAARRLRREAGNDLVVIPVPLFAAREKTRGYNQARVLAEAMVKRMRRLEPGWNLQMPEQVLVRVHDTRALYALNPTQRRASLKGAFRVADAQAVRGREVLLVDDIMTTGATARECARVLKRAGAAKVWVVTAAKAQPESVHSTAEHDEESFTMWTAPAAVPVPLITPDSSRQNRFF
jgi:ComF family protein